MRCQTIETPYGEVMVALTARGVTKRHPEATVLSDLSLFVDDGEALVVLGPSGSGKTTLLRLIAGLDRPSEGDLLFDGVSIADVPPSRRDVAVVFEDDVFYPRKRVRDNIAFPLRVRRFAGAEIDARVRAEARAMRIEDALERLPGTLSAGHRRLVQLARAMVRAPGIFLIDEPLGRLDSETRRQLRLELRRLQQGYGVTAVYTTHDYEDALVLGDRIAVLENGSLRQVGAGRELYERPADTFVARFVGTPPMSLLEGTAGSTGVAVGELLLAGPAGLTDRVIVGVRAQDWRTAADGLAGTVGRIEDHGAQTFAEVDTTAGGTIVRLEAPVKPASALHLEPTRYHLFDPASGRSLSHVG